MKTRFAILALGVSVVSSAWADDFDTPGERAALERQLDPVGLPGWHALKPTSPSSSPTASPELLEKLRKRTQRLNEKLDAIRLPKIDLENTPLRDAISQIRDEIKRLDADATAADKGVNILFKLDSSSTPVPSAVTLRLRNVTVRDALKQFAAQLKARIDVTPYGVVLLPN